MDAPVSGFLGLRSVPRSGWFEALVMAVSVSWVMYVFRSSGNAMALSAVSWLLELRGQLTEEVLCFDVIFLKLFDMVVLNVPVFDRLSQGGSCPLSTAFGQVRHDLGRDIGSGEVWKNG
ncbi:hypothetical protein [Myxococcus xanthus]|uniref:hypothetical protein n=1 Tax=Myxococcus xanthus TaxID=34 RepID=UPI00148BF37A|nr:hypothetical protein [Myxococcus xanthus]